MDLETLVLRYRPLARSVARRHSHGPGGLEDLEQVACLGLVKAIQGFDPARGFAFSTYAVPTIAGELKRWYRQTAWAAHVPRRVQERVVAVRATADRLTTARGRPATAEAVARALRCETEDVIDALCAAEALMPVSLDGAVGTDADGVQRHGLSAEDPGFELAEDRAAVEDALMQLGRHERELLRLRFDEELTHERIAQRLGTTPGGVAHALRGILDHLGARDARPQRGDRRIGERASGGRCAPADGGAPPWRPPERTPRLLP